MVKLHQLVITNDREEDLKKPIEAEDAIEEEEIENTEVCLLTFSKEAISDESWLHKKTSGYRTQKATLSVKEKVGRVDTFSNYLISPLRKRYDTFFKSTMCILKAMRCWLKLKPTDSVPKGWLNKREKIYNRIEQLDKTSIREATIEEIDDKVIEKIEANKPEVTKNRKRVNMASRIRNSYEAITFNILRREEYEELQNWKSYPGINKIVKLARNVVEKNARNEIANLIKMMKAHESQQTAPIIATIAIIIGSKLKNKVTREIRQSVGDIIS